MGFFDSIMNAINESIEVGKSSYNTQNKWKKEEKEYYNISRSYNFDINRLIELKELKEKEIKCDLMIKYGDSKDINGYKKERYAVHQQIQELKKNKNIIDDSNEYTEFIDNYNNARDKRVAFCISYLNHPKSTSQGRKDAMMIIFLSPCYRSVSHMKMDLAFLKERFSIYEKRLNNKENLSVLDYCFYGNIFVDAEILPHSFFSEDYYLKKLRDITTCQNSMEYNDEMYGTHISQPSFFKLSMNYTHSTALEEEKIISSIVENLSNDKE